MKRVVLIIFILLITVSFTACAHDKQNTTVNNSVNTSTNDSSQLSGEIDPLQPVNTDPFGEYIYSGTFEELAKKYQETGTDGFVRYISNRPSTYLEITEQRIADRKMELSRSFPGYTYIPCHNGKRFEIVEDDPLRVFIPSYAQERSWSEDGTSNLVTFHTELQYTAAVVHKDGYKTYAYINIIHGKERAVQAWSSVLKGNATFIDYKGYLYGPDKDEYGEIVIDGKTVPYCRANPIFYDANYIFKYNDETLIAISFFSSDEWIVADEIDFFERFEDHCLPREFMTTEWLSNLSFEKYNFGKTDDDSVS